MLGVGNTEEITQLVKLYRRTYMNYLFITSYMEIHLWHNLLILFVKNLSYSRDCAKCWGYDGLQSRQFLSSCN